MSPSIVNYDAKRFRGAQTGGPANHPNATLIDAEFAGADLRKANLNGADLRRANLAGADLSLAYLVGADLRGAPSHRAPSPGRAAASRCGAR